MKKKLLITLACLLLLAGCGTVKLTNGENALVKFSEGDGISTDDLYQAMKGTYGASTLRDLVDRYLLERLYKETDDEKAYVKQAIKTATETAKSYSVDLETYLQYYYGMASESVFKDYLSLNYKRNLWVQDYAKQTVTDTQINDYYETQTIGDIEASHILITVDVNENATEEEKTKAKEAALQKANEVIDRLKGGEDFAKLAITYSKDENTVKDGGYLGFVNKGDVTDEVLNALKSLKDGSYSTTPIETTYGYHIVYRTSQKEKPELNDEVKEEIKTIIGKEIAAADGFSTTALTELREKYKMNILDSELKDSFKN